MLDWYTQELPSSEELGSGLALTHLHLAAFVIFKVCVWVQNLTPDSLMRSS